MKGLIGFLVGKMYLISKLVIHQDLTKRGPADSR
jgi:hypothetical protein